MRALTILEPGILELQEVEDPTPGADEVVVEVGACGLCGTDLHLIDSALQIVPWTMPSSSCPIAQTVMHRPLDRGAACRPLATR